MDISLIVEESAGLRLDKYISERIDMTRSQVDKLIGDGLVLVNGALVKSNYKVKLGDEIEITERVDEFKLVPSPMDLDIVYEDEYILIINKNEGVVMHPGYGNDDGTLVNGLLYNNIPLGNADDPIRPGIVHRLDKETSGLLVVAKTDEAYYELIEMFTNREIVKKYIGIVKGELDSGVVNAPLARAKSDRRKMEVNRDNGKEAITEYRALELLNGYTLVEFNLITGRMHQIRAHMKSIGHPIAGDSMYGHGEGGKLMLHSYKMAFDHPVTGEEIEVETEYPKEFLEFIETKR